MSNFFPAKYFPPRSVVIFPTEEIIQPPSFSLNMTHTVNELLPLSGKFIDGKCYKSMKKNLFSNANERLKPPITGKMRLKTSMNLPKLNRG